MSRVDPLSCAGSDVGSKTKARSLSAKLKILVGLIVLIVGGAAGIVMAGWVTHNVALVQIRPEFSPMQFNTAVLFLLAAFALVAVLLGRPCCAANLGLLITGFALLTLLQYLTPLDFKIDQLFLKPFTGAKTSDLGRMSPPSAVNFLLLGLGFSFYLKSAEKRRIICLFFSILVFTLAISALLGYVFGVESTYGWGGLTRMAVHTCLCFLLLAVALASLNWMGDYRYWPVLLIFCPGLVMTLFVTQIMASLDEAQTKAEFINMANNRILAINRRFVYTSRLLRGARAFYEGSVFVDRGEFTSFVAKMRDGTKSIQSIEWIKRVSREDREAFEAHLKEEGFDGISVKEPEGMRGYVSAPPSASHDVILYTEPDKAHSDSIGFDRGHNGVIKKTIDQARDSNRKAATPLLATETNTGEDNRVIFVFEPIYTNGADLSLKQSRRKNFEGVLAAVIWPPQFIARALQDVTERPIDAALVDVTQPENPEVVFLSGDIYDSARMLGFFKSNYRTMTGLFEVRQIRFGSRKYQIVIFAGPKYVLSQQTWYPTATFLLMLLLTLAVTFFVAQGITRRRELELFALRLEQANDVSESARNNLQAILDAATDVSIVATDTRGLIQVFNRGAERMLGWKADEMIGLNTPALFHESSEIEKRGRELSDHTGRPIKGFAVFVELARQGITDEREWTYVRKDGTCLTVSLVISAIYNTQKELTGFLGIAMNISERKRMEQVLKQVSDDALEASRAKSDFLATMSHEIRTPMNAILGMAELLAETELTNDQLQYVKTLSRGGETLLALINDVLDLSKIESGVIEIEEADYSAREVTERVVEILAIAAHRKHIELSASISSKVPEIVVGDAARVRQVLMNLIGNAIKFTEDGEVAVELVLAEDQLKFSVRDTGIGIAQEKLEAIFNPFTQADSSTTRKYGGTGLGLSISKKLVELMGGAISVDSETGKGSCFSFLLPLKTPAETASSVAATGVESEVLKGKKVLIVDDNATNRLIIRKATSLWGMESEEATGGTDCLERIEKKRKEGGAFDLILMDCRMPGMGGFDVGQKLKQTQALDCPMIIMLTSDGRSGDVERAQHLGFEAYLIKPIRRSELLRIILSVFKKHKVEDRSVAAEAKAIQGVRKILLAEDSPDNQDLIKAYLKQEPYEIDIADNGKIALEKALQAHYDLILMDMQMPVMDGYEATQLIRAHAKPGSGQPRVFIVALTANALQKDAERCFAAGCDAYLSKPIKKTVLLEALSGYLDSTAK